MSLPGWRGNKLTPINGWQSGTVQAYSSPASNAEKFTSLAGISFPLGS